MKYAGGDEVPMKWDCVCTDCGSTFEDESKSRPRTCPSCGGHHLKVAKRNDRRPKDEFGRLAKEFEAAEGTESIGELVEKATQRVLAELPSIRSGRDADLLGLYNMSLVAEKAIGGGSCGMLIGILDRMRSAGAPDAPDRALRFTQCHNDISQMVITHDCDIRRIRAVADADLAMARAELEALGDSEEADDMRRVVSIDEAIVAAIDARVADLSDERLDEVAEGWRDDQTPFQKAMAEAASLMYYMRMGHPNVTEDSIVDVVGKAVDAYING